MRKNVGKNLRYLDLSENAHNFGYAALPMVIAFNFKRKILSLKKNVFPAFKITQECPSLVYLNVSKMNISNFILGKLIKKCNSLKELNIAHCTQITDSSLTRLFQNCKNLEKLNITFCHLVTGKCFYEKAKPQNLEHLVIDGCESVIIKKKFLKDNIKFLT